MVKMLLAFSFLVREFMVSFVEILSCIHKFRELPRNHHNKVSSLQLFLKYFDEIC